MPTLHRIDPHNLRDTIVEIRYEGVYDFSVLKGIFYEIFKDELTSLTTLANIKIQLRGQGELKLNGFEGLDFRKDEVKITFTEERIHFNTLETYPGWEAFRTIIQKVIARLEHRQLIRYVKQTGLRYISDHQHRQISEIAKVTWSLGTQYGMATQATLRQQYRYESDRVTVTLANTILTGEEQTPVAVMDIDVTHQFEPDSPVTDSLLDTIERLHRVQKMFFEDIIQPGYLNSLNPEYR